MLLPQAMPMEEREDVEETDEAAPPGQMHVVGHARPFPQGMPASQSSFPGTRRPSPQIVPQLYGPVPWHTHPDSMVHVAEQPSPKAVLPSSHASVPVRIPSPHRGTQTESGKPEQR